MLLCLYVGLSTVSTIHPSIHLFTWLLMIRNFYWLIAGNCSWFFECIWLNTICYFYSSAADTFSIFIYVTMLFFSVHFVLLLLSVNSTQTFNLLISRIARKFISIQMNYDRFDSWTDEVIRLLTRREQCKGLFLPHPHQLHHSSAEGTKYNYRVSLLYFIKKYSITFRNDIPKSN